MTDAQEFNSDAVAKKVVLVGIDGSTYREIKVTAAGKLIVAVS